MLVSILFDKFFENLPKVIETAAESPLGIVALAIIAISFIISLLIFLSRVLFHTHPYNLSKLIAFSLTAGVIIFGFSIIRELAISSKLPDTPIASPVITPALVPTPHIKHSPSINEIEERLKAAKEIARQASAKLSPAKTIKDLKEGKELLVSAQNLLDTIPGGINISEEVSIEYQRYDFVIIKINNLLWDLDKVPVPPNLQDSCFVKQYGNCEPTNMSF